MADFDETHPQGLVVSPFKAPSAEEAAHDFLWRVHPRAPAKGMIAVFNRSHYEAVIAERVLGFADAAECKRRCRQIVNFERLLIEHGTTIVKCFLHISKDEQKKRLQPRLDERDEALEVERERPRRAQALGREHGRVQRRDPAHRDEGCAVVDRAGRCEERIAT